MRRGTKHFSPGAKVYCFPALWGDGYENVQVVGRHRGSHRYFKMIMSARYLTNWRADLVYSPHVIREFEGHWDGSEKSKELAELVVSKVPQVWVPREPPAPEPGTPSVSPEAPQGPSVRRDLAGCEKGDLGEQATKEPVADNGQGAAENER